MESVYDFLQVVVDVCGWYGIALIAVLCITLVAEIYCWVSVYGSIAGFRLQRRKKIRDTEPPVSVVVPLFSENLAYLDEGLVELLTQEYPNFEVVAVYIGNDESFFADLSRLHNHYAHLKAVQIDYSPQYPVSVKTALNVGIKSASYEHVVMTTTDAVPASRRWLALLARGFMYGDVVIGYCGIERKRGFMDHFYREFRFTESIVWLSSAIRRHPFGASHHNLGFTKSLYFGVRGFNHLNMSVGEDDLFVQQIATPDNVAVVLSPKVACTERRHGGWSWWYNKDLRRQTTRRFYPVRAKMSLSAELVVRSILFVAAIVGLLLLPPAVKIFAGAVLVIRALVVQLSALRIARRLGERGLMSRHLLFDLAEPLIRLTIRYHTPKRYGKYGNNRI